MKYNKCLLACALSVGLFSGNTFSSESALQNNPLPVTGVDNFKLAAACLKKNIVTHALKPLALELSRGLFDGAVTSKSAMYLAGLCWIYQMMLSDKVYAEKKNLTLYKPNNDDVVWITKQFSQKRECKELVFGESSSGPAVFGSGDDCILHFPKNDEFNTWTFAEKRGVIAHEANHFAYKHWQKKLPLMSLISTTPVAVYELFFKEQSESAATTGMLGVGSVLLGPIVQESVISRIFEYEADTKGNSPEEIYGLSEFFCRCIFKKDHAVSGASLPGLSLYDNVDSLTKSILDRVADGQEIDEYSRPVSCFKRYFETHPTHSDRIKNCMKVFKEQMHDEPKTKDECLQALAFYARWYALSEATVTDAKSEAEEKALKSQMSVDNERAPKLVKKRVQVLLNAMDKLSTPSE